MLMDLIIPKFTHQLILKLGSVGYLCRPKELAAREDPMQWSHLRIATKYPNILNGTLRLVGSKPMHKTNGAMELAPRLGLCRRIVDLVSSGATLTANGLVEMEKISDISARLAVNRAAFKTNPRQ